MSWTQEDLTALNSAIAQGVKKVAYRDRTIEYRDLKEMLTLKSQMDTALGVVKRTTRIYQGTVTGL